MIHTYYLLKLLMLKSMFCFSVEDPPALNLTMDQSIHVGWLYTLKVCYVLINFQVHLM